MGRLSVRYSLSFCQRRLSDVVLVGGVRALHFLNVAPRGPNLKLKIDAVCTQESIFY